MKRVTVGGQAVIEGVMMKEKNHYAVAIRKPDQEIVCIKKECKSLSDKCKLFKLPIFRGMLAFVESMMLGVSILTLSAEYFEDDTTPEEPGGFDKFLNKVFKDKADDIIMGIAVLFAIAFSVGLFILLPSFISHLLRGIIKYNVVLNLAEGLIRITLFLTYVVAISYMKDIRRVYEYHGAEHKTINCLEHEEELTVENVRKYSRLHKRCGTSFLLIVMIITMLFFMFINTDTLLMKMALRLLLIPVVAGISYEFLRFAGRSDSIIMDILSKPGMALQKLTTREPDDSQIEVAITAVNEVLEHEQQPAECCIN
ncbi:MAG: hypothetical protein K0R15_2127 [Clostridiales bacterium]|jgi:uncharacterized protein YqhQ|nr:hypothetical protein [Clostridiales bacterium]